MTEPEPNYPYYDAEGESYCPECDTVLIRDMAIDALTCPLCEVVYD